MHLLLLPICCPNRNGNIELLHRCHCIGWCSLDVVGAGGCYVRMSQDHLNGFLRHSEGIKIASQTRPGCVPAVPKRLQVRFLESGQNHSSLHIIQAERFPVPGCEDRARLGIPAAHTMPFQHSCHRAYHRHGSFALERFRRCSMPFPNSLRNVDLTIPVVLPSHAADLPTSKVRKRRDRKDRCCRFGQQRQNGLDLSKAVGVRLLRFFDAGCDRCVSHGAFPTKYPCCFASLNMALSEHLICCSVRLLKLLA